jgi:hypothetical protein
MLTKHGPPLLLGKDMILVRVENKLSRKIGVPKENEESEQFILLNEEKIHVLYRSFCIVRIVKCTSRQGMSIGWAKQVMHTQFLLRNILRNNFED